MAVCRLWCFMRIGMTSFFLQSDQKLLSNPVQYLRFSACPDQTVISHSHTFTHTFALRRPHSNSAGQCHRSKLFATVDGCKIQHSSHKWLLLSSFPRNAASAAIPPVLMDRHKRQLQHAPQALFGSVAPKPVGDPNGDPGETQGDPARAR